MSDPRWLRAAVVVAGLAGASADEAFASLDPIDAVVAARRLAGLRAAGDRAAVAVALVRERLALTGAAAVTAPADSALGSRFLARWMRGLPPADRGAAARSLDAGTARAVAVMAASPQGAGPLGSSRAVTASWLVARACTRLGRMPSAAEWSELLGAMAGGAAVASGPMVRIERGVRLSGHRRACAALAVECASAGGA